MPLLSRRRVLATGGWVAGAAALVASAAFDRAGASPRATAPTTPGPTPTGPAGPVTPANAWAVTPTAASPTAAAVSASPARHPAGRATPSRRPAARSSSRPAPHPKQPGAPWSGPVYSLADYSRHDPRTRFPADAIMLTIDDGPDPTWTPQILNLLARYDVKATFCVIGTQARAHPSLVRATAGEGHHLANHTFSHPLSLPSLSAAPLQAQIVDAQDAIVRASGVTPRLFRSPGGNWGPRVFAALAAPGLVPLDWDVDPRDWSRPGVGRIESALLATGPGQIALCHDGGGDRSQTFAALSRVVPALKARGLRFVTLPA